MPSTDVPSLRWLKLSLSLWLAFLVLAGLFVGRHWPLVNDGALQHYITFLSDSGLAPYREIADMNLPGSLMLDWTVVHTLGPGPVAWRVFDAVLLLLAAAAMLAIARPWSFFPGVAAAALFALLHLRDGMGQTGQRDLTESVLLLGLLASVLLALRSHRPWLSALAGLCAGAALIIKPDSLLLSALVLLVARPHLPLPRRSLVLVCAFALVPLAAAALFLLHHRAVSAFWLSLSQITPFYASLGRQGFGELLRDCLSTPMRILLALAVLLSLLRRRPWPRERTLLALATAWGLVSFFLQGKGYLYHRYPTLAFVLLWAFIECAAAFQDAALIRSLAVAGVLYASLVVAPLSLVRATHARWNSDLLDALQSDLTRLGGTSASPESTLSGEVQCVDSISGCNIVLLRMRLREPSGILSDFLLFGPKSEPAVRRARTGFSADVLAHPPRILVITGWLHPVGLDNFQKLTLWPTFDIFLRSHYTLATERHFAPGQNGPLAYRIYLRR